MTAPKVLLLVEDEAVSGAIRFALEVEEIEVVVFANFEALQQAVGQPGSRIVIDRGPGGTEALELLKQLRMQGMTAPAVILASTPAKGLDASVAELGAVLVEKPLLCNELVAALRSFPPSGGRLQ